MDDWIIDLIALEKALVQHGAVKEVAVIVREEAARPSLVAYIVASCELTEQRIEGFLRHQLPSANVGMKVVLLSELPGQPRTRLIHAITGTEPDPNGGEPASRATNGHRTIDRRNLVRPDRTGASRRE